MQTDNCPNCNYAFTQKPNYCAGCGQKTNIHRFNSGHLLHEMVHAFTHADKGVFFLIKELAIRPGIVLREYILEYKQKKYFNPFTFLFLAGALLLVCTFLFKPYFTDTGISAAQTTQLEKVMGTEKAVVIAQRMAKLNVFLEKNSKMLTITYVPLYALVFWLCFKGRPINFAEHFIAMVFLTGFLSLVLALITTPLLGVAKGSSWYNVPTWAALLFQCFYFGYAYIPFLEKTGRVNKWKPYAVSALNLLVWSLITGIIGSLYIYSFLFA